MKQRFSSLDVKLIAHELSASLRDLIVVNCYDLSSRIFLFKFHKSGHREQLIIDSGFRCHLTSFARTTAAEPSGFVSRLRKSLKNRRVTSVAQVGDDRIIEVSFNNGMHRLFLEFYAGGNIILCDQDLKVAALLRRVPAGAGEEEIKEGMQYPIEKKLNFHGPPSLTLPDLRESLQNYIDKAADHTPAKKPKRKQGDGLRRALSAYVPAFPSVLLEHAFKVRHFDGSTSPEDLIKDEDKLQRLLDVLEEARQLSEEIVTFSPAKGFIIAKPAKKRPSLQQKSGSDGDKENIALVYEDFHPFKPRQFEDKTEATIIEISGFNKTVDDFFSSLEAQKLETRLTERELVAQRKIDTARRDHAERIGGLQQVQELNVRKAQALEANLDRVEEATDAVNGLIAQGMDWKDIASLIRTEQKRRNPVAAIIKLPLNLDENTITLMLAEEQVDDDQDLSDDSTNDDTSSDDEKLEKEAKPATEKAVNNLLSVEVNLALSAWANAGQYYDEKRTAANKQNRTSEASKAALKRHEAKVQADLKKNLAKEKQTLHAIHQPLWFEKFYHFISSEGYLVLGARDKSQSDLLYQRHLDRDDVWVHCDVEEASHIVIKNKVGAKGAPISPTTLAQAGTICVCSSSAWDRKAIMGAWWVGSSQVSKLAPNGDYLGQGAFEIKGEKQHLPPAQLLLGIGVMFKLSPESMAKRVKTILPTTEEPSDQSEIISTVKSTSDESIPIKEEGASHNYEQESQDVAGEPNKHSESEREEENDNPYRNPLQNTQYHEYEEDQQGSTMQNGSENGGGGDKDDINNAREDRDVEEFAAEHSAEDVRSDHHLAAGPSIPKIYEDTDSVVGGSDAGSTVTKEKAAPQVRGKHGKKAKIKSKYAWQDEEDRTLALRILGSSKGQEKKTDDAGQQAAKEAADAAAKERRQEQRRLAQEKGKAAEEARRRRLASEASAGEAGGDEDDELVEDISVVDRFVGMPKPGDMVEDVIVVCAPWEVMGTRFQWRVKIQPGPLKRGKGLKEILGGWQREIAAREKKRLPSVEGNEGDRGDGASNELAEEQLLRREGDLIKTIRDVEVVGSIAVKSFRAVMSGGSGGGGGTDGGKGKGGGKGGGGGSAGQGGRGGKGSKKR